VTFTDHDTMRAYDLLSSELDGLVTGVEMRIKDLDLAGHTIHIMSTTSAENKFLELKEISETGRFEKVS